MAGSGEVIRNLDDYGNRLKAALRALGEHYAAKMEGDAKQNAPWTDRIPQARPGLFGDVSEEDQALKVRIAHSVEYGVYLELANQGRFAILEPTTKKHAPDFFRDADRVVRGR